MDTKTTICTEDYKSLSLLREDIARLQTTVSNGLLKNVAEHKEQLRELTNGISTLRETLAGHIAEERALESMVNRVVTTLLVVAGGSITTIVGVSGWALSQLIG